MTAPVLLVVGADKLSQRLVTKLDGVEGVQVAVNRSVSVWRLMRLIGRRALRISDVVNMAWAEVRRDGSKLDHNRFLTVDTNSQLLSLIEDHGIRRVFLFRAGLIVSPSVLGAGADIFNIHCASLDGFGGLASIRRALEAGALDQHATLHRITSRIDEGEIIMERKYRLSPNMSYMSNEDVAYAAGIELLRLRCYRQLSDCI